jgi:hypothetical protein
MFRSLFSVFAALILALLPAVAMAQSNTSTNTGTITGTVRDSSGAAIPGASVRIVADATTVAAHVVPGDQRTVGVTMRVMVKSK